MNNETHSNWSLSPGAARAVQQPAAMTGWEALADAPARSGPAPGLEYASPARRIGAYLVDGMLLFFIATFVEVLVLAAAAPDLAGAEPGTGAPVVTFATSVLAALVSAGYFMLPWRMRGATTGQLLLGLRVANAADGARLSWRAVLVRWVALTAGGAVWVPDVAHPLAALQAVWFAVLLISAVIDGRNQGLHDRWAHSLVVRRVPAAQQDGAEPVEPVADPAAPARTAVRASGGALLVLLLVGAVSASWVDPSGAPPDHPARQNVPSAGEVWFGSSFDADTFEVRQRTETVSTSQALVVVSHLRQSAKAEELNLRISLDGQLVGMLPVTSDPLNASGEGDLIGFSAGPLGEVGNWTFEVTDIGGNVLASGLVRAVDRQSQSSRGDPRISSVASAPEV